MPKGPATPGQTPHNVAYIEGLMDRQPLKISQDET